MAVTSPVDELTVATAALELVHCPPALPVVVRLVVLPGQRVCVPLIVPADGAALTVTVLVAVAF